MKKIEMLSGETRIYNLACTPVDLPGTTARLMGCRLAPGESSEAHNHVEHEIFIFAAGEGRVEHNGEAMPVAAGDAVLFERFQNHVIVNTSRTAPLLFHSVYWPGEAEAAAPAPAAPAALVLSTPPTPNGDLHLGHLAGPYLAADVLTRVLRAAGYSARHVTGRDDHQTYVWTCGLREGRSAGDTADHYDRLLRDTWARFGIALDGYVDPTATPAYADFVHHGIALLRERGLVVARTGPAAHDGSGRYLHEALVTGRCPHCGEGSDGNACEACGRPNVCVDLADAVATGSGEPIVVAPVERLHFRLSALATELETYVKTADMPAHVSALALDLIADGLPDVCIGHPGPWGLSHAEEGFADHRVYVWFEMAFGYLWGAADRPDGSPGDVLEAARRIYDGRTEIVHCYGFDNAFYHALLFPAVYLALGLVPPRTHVVNELLDLDGRKFSTSRRHLIWGRDFVAAVPRDYARFALMLRRPEAVRENFVLESVRDDLNAVFAGALNRWLTRFAERLRARGNVMPDPGAWLADQRQFHAWLTGQIAALDRACALDSFSPRAMARILRDLVLEGERFSAGQAPLLAAGRRGVANHARTALALEALALRALARASAAVMPDLSAALTALLGLGDAAPVEFLPGGLALPEVPLPDLPPVEESLAERLAPPAGRGRKASAGQAE